MGHSCFEEHFELLIFFCAAPGIAKILNPIDWHGWMGRLKDKYIVGYILADRWTDRSAQMY